MNIAIIGFGVEGKALAQYFSRQKHNITVCDIGEKEKAALKNTKIHFRLGPHYLDSLEKFDLIFRSPGIPYLKKEFDAVRNKLTSLTQYFFEECPCPIVGITGTKGKGTTATLIYEMLKQAKSACKNSKVFFGGNIGSPPLNFLDELTPKDIVVLELSSFQLQDLKQSPHIAVVLGVTPDHLDHHADMDEYVDAKKNIVRFQTAEDFAILNADNKISESFSKNTKAKTLLFSTKKEVFLGETSLGGFLKAGSLIIKHGKTGIFVGEKGQTGIVGEHNLENILAAAVSANILNVPVEIITKVIKEWKGLPHRLEFVHEIAGVRYYNDSASTNPQTAIAALRAFSSPTILIAGGSDKNADFAPLAEEIARRANVKTVVLMGVTKDKITKAVEKAVAEHNSDGGKRREAPLEIISAESYQEAFMVSRMIAQAGDTVLLSPACASFDMFGNYQERGNIFRDFVMNFSK